MRVAGTPWPHLDKYPPLYVRLLAKRPGSGSADMAITDAHIAANADMEIDRVREISQMTNWDDVTVSEMRRFLTACEFDPTNSAHRQRVVIYEITCQKRNTVPFHYLRRSPRWEAEFLPLIRRLSEILPRQSALMPSTREGITHARTSP